MSFNGATRKNLDDLFPAPSLPPSSLSPQRLPGANLEALAAIQHVLKDNHTRHHIFLKETRFHNHIAHRALAIYALGGQAAIIRDYYERDGHMQRPAFESPEPITEDNFVDHLGDEKYYQAYITFFSKQISEKGAARTLEEFIFSEKYNFQEGRDANAQPEMLARMFAGLVHPFIHLGYGVEFGLMGMLIEGLALVAVDYGHIQGALPLPYFAPTGVNNMQHVIDSLSSLALDNLGNANASTVSKTNGVHAFDIVARILKDNRLMCEAPTDFLSKLVALIKQFSPMIREHVEQWSINLNQPGEIERKMEEVIWVSTILYGIGGSTRDGFRADFMLMHLVTSSLFLPSVIVYLSPRSQALLLRGYFITSLTWWVIRGRPALNIKSFMTSTSVELSIATTPAPKTPPTTETTLIPNPFLPILQSAITHPNDHLIKIQRAFSHFDTLYGRRSTGYFKGTELEDAALLDGSVFLRASLLTADYMGWVREGKEEGHFSVEGFFA